MFNYVDRRNVGVEKKSYLCLTMWIEEMLVLRKSYLCLTMWIEEMLVLRKKLLMFNYVDRRNVGVEKKVTYV